MPIQFACPHCGKQTVVADEFAGRSGPCAGCGKNVSVPFGGTPAYPAATARGSGGGAGTALIVMGIVLVVGLLVCVGGIGLVAFPVVGRARMSAQRASSQNNLKQIGIAIHNYHDTYKQLPPAIVKDSSGKPLYSGMVLLLPYLEQSALYDQFDKAKAWDDPANIDLSKRMILPFTNPASTSTTAGHSDYMLVGGPNAMLSETGQMSFANVVDGTSNTIMAVEVGSAPESWAMPVAWDPSQPFNGPDPTMVNVLFGDGSVRALPKTLPVQTLRLIYDRQDGNSVDLP